MRKGLLVIMVMLLAVSFAAFAGGDQEQPAGGSGETSEGGMLSADGKYPAETIKIGFVNYDTTAQQVLDLQEYFEYLQSAFNFEIIWSESLKSAEAEFDFIEQCAAAGCKGIIGYYNEGRAESIKLAESLGMYYYGEAMNEATYEPAKDIPTYVGGHYTGNGDYDFGKAVARMLVDAGAHKIIVMSGGKEYGVEFFVDRYNGIMDGMKEARESGYDIEMVYEVPGWPGTEEFAAHQTAALQTDADGLAGTLTALMWIQPMQNAGKFGEIKVASIGEGVSEDIIGLWHAGFYVGMCSEISGMFGMSIPLLFNAIMGYGDQIRNPDGTAPKVSAKNWVIDNVDDLMFYASTETTGGAWTFNIDDLKSLMVDFNPDVTLEDYEDLYTAVSADEIKTRRAE